MTIKSLRFFICIAIVGFCTARASATVLFSDNFNVDDGASWTVNTAPTGATIAGQQQATFAYDYSAMGIPPAPGSTDTLGLRLRANIPGSAAAPVTTRPSQTTSGLSVSPTGQNFLTNYTVQFYAWSNFFGAPNASGLADNANSEGGTNNVMFAVGTSGTVPIVVGNTGLVTGASMDAVGFATTADGGITNDYRAYPASGTLAPTTVLAANSYSNTATLYTTLFGTHTAPAIQQTVATAEYGGDASPTQAGSTQTGSFGFAWHKVVITKNNNSVTWAVNDTLLATVDASTLTLGGANIALGESDVNATTARHPSLVFTVFDNLTVSTVTPAGIPGDFDNSGAVDAADYVVWRKHLGEATEAALNGHGDGLNGVDSGDYTLWRAHYGAPPGSGALAGASVPEPSSLLLLVFSAGCCCWPARRRS